MSTSKQPRPRKADAPPPDLPSTPRAVAWTAMLLAVVALGISLVTLALTWQDGRLVGNAGQLMQEVRQTMDQIKSRSEAQTEAEAEEEAGPLRWDRIEEKLGRIEQMIGEGNRQARFHIDNLADDFEMLRAYSTEDVGHWLRGAGEQLRQAREELAENAPAAATRLRELARQAHGKLPGGGDPAEGEAAADE